MSKIRLDGSIQTTGSVKKKYKFKEEFNYGMYKQNLEEVLLNSIIIEKRYYRDEHNTIFTFLETDSVAGLVSVNGSILSWNDLSTEYIEPKTPDELYRENWEKIFKK
jgi:hypothetical protein